MLDNVTDLVRRITAPGATLNARHEIEQATTSIVDLETQLYRVHSSSPPQAA
jgi:hypothetical protein